MYTNGMGFRTIERIKGVHHTTIIHWVKLVGQQLPNAPDASEIPEVTEHGRTRNICRFCIKISKT